MVPVMRFWFCFTLPITGVLLLVLALATLVFVLVVRLDLVKGEPLGVFCIALVRDLYHAPLFCGCKPNSVVDFEDLGLVEVTIVGVHREYLISYFVRTAGRGLVRAQRRLRRWVVVVAAAARAAVGEGAVFASIGAVLDWNVLVMVAGGLGMEKFAVPTMVWMIFAELPKPAPLPERFVTGTPCLATRPSCALLLLPIPCVMRAPFILCVARPCLLLSRRLERGWTLAWSLAIGHLIPGRVTPSWGF